MNFRTFQNLFGTLSKPGSSLGENNRACKKGKGVNLNKVESEILCWYAGSFCSIIGPFSGTTGLKRKVVYSWYNFT